MLKAESLALKRGNILVFRQLGFNLERGETLIVTGRNGSGKSSLLRALAGLLPLFEGALFWQGERLMDFRDYQTKLTYLGHENALKPELTLRQMIDYWHALHLSQTSLSLELLETFGLKGKEHTLIGQLSAGQKRRLALLRLPLSAQRLWLLDEPLTALDAKGGKLFEDLVIAHAHNGGITVIATHQPITGPNSRTLALDGVRS